MEFLLYNHAEEFFRSYFFSSNIPIKLFPLFCLALLSSFIIIETNKNILRRVGVHDEREKSKRSINSWNFFVIGYLLGTLLNLNLNRELKYIKMNGRKWKWEWTVSITIIYFTRREFKLQPFIRLWLCIVTFFSYFNWTKNKRMDVSRLQMKYIYSFSFFSLQKTKQFYRIAIGRNYGFKREMQMSV